MKNDILAELKKWLPKFYINGEWVKGKVTLKYNGGLEASEESTSFLRELLYFLFEGDMVNNCTIIWLTSNQSSMRAAFEVYNSERPAEENININTAMSKVQYDRKKLEKYFSPSEILNILAYPEKYLDSAIEKLDRLERLYMKDLEYNRAMVIKMNKEPMSYSVDDYEWAKLLEIIERYSKKKIEAIESGNDEELTSNMIGYYNHLISCGRLSEKEKARLNKIRSILGLGDKKW